MNRLLHALMDRADSGSKALSTAEQATVMRDLRKSKARRPDLVIKYRTAALDSVKGEMEQLNLFEQIVIAALDLREEGILESFLQKLVKRFAQSSRVERLRGMRCEARGEFDDALAIYAELLKANPSNMLVMKRKVCVYRVQGRLKEAVEEMHRILKLFASDASTWFELSEVHLSRGEFAEAAHCMEELVMLDPECAHYNARLADIYYSMGTLPELQLARKHYTLSLVRQNAPINLRALYGLHATLRALQAASPLNHKNDAVERELLSFSQETINEVAESSGKTLAFVSGGATNKK